MIRFKYFWLILLIISGIAARVSAQERENAGSYSNEKLLSIIHQDLRNHQINDAVFFLNIYCGKNPHSYSEVWRLAEMERSLGHIENAAHWYEVIVNANPGKNIIVKGAFDFIGDNKNTSKYQKYPLARFYYAGLLKKQAKYFDSEQQFKIFIWNYHEKDSAYYSSEVSREIEGIELINKLGVPDPAIKLSPVNAIKAGDYQRYAPHFYNDSTIFYYRTTWKNRYMARIPQTELFYADCRKGIWYDSVRVKGWPKSDKYIDLNGCFSKDKKRYYFTRCHLVLRYPSDQRSRIPVEAKDVSIYCCNVHNKKFSRFVKLDTFINKPGSWNMMPALGADEKGNDVLYFVSNRPGGFGGFDIWKATYGHKKFGDPVNLGSNINTRHDEVTPFYLQDSDRLYFSSEGWPGLGGLDIFSSKNSTKGWSSPKNIGFPFNSYQDEMYFIISTDNHYGMFTRNTVCVNGDVCNPIVIPYFECQAIECFRMPYPQYYIEGKVFAVKGKDIIKVTGVQTMIYGKSEGMQEEELLKTPAASFLVQIKPKADYRIHITADGYRDRDTALNTDTFTHSDTIYYVFILEEIPKDTPIVLKNILFNFNDSTLTKASEKELDNTLLKYMQKNPNDKIMIISHTDSIGSDEYNMKLSEARARSIIRYLVGKGISPRRMLPKGYGFRHPVAPNKNRDGSDNPAGRELNRRTEFRAIGKMK